MSALTMRDRRALTMGAAVLVAAFGLVYGVRPALASLNDRRESAARESELLERERALLAEAPSLPAQIVAARASLAARAVRVVRSDEPETAALTLASIVRTAARAAEVRLLQVSDAPSDTTRSGLPIARVTVRAESDVRGVLRFVRALEGDQLAGRLAAFTVTPSASRIANGSADGEAHLLSLAATIEAPIQPRRVGGDAPTPVVATDKTLDAAVASTIADNPFAADRMPGPSFRITAVPVTPVTVAPRAVVRLIGTVVQDAARSFVMCAEGSGPSKLVYVGGKIGELTLRSIEQGSATFTDGAGRAVVLRVPRGGE